MLTIGTTLKYYKRKDIQESIVEHSRNREVAPRFNDAFGSRPDIVQYPHDILEFAKNGVTSFHCSEERWNNPLQLVPGMRARDMDELRSGWDLVIDVDCKNWEYSKLITHLIIQIIKSFGISAVSVKFSGNKGFHIGVPWEAFPGKVHGKDTKTLFPDGPRRIASYIIHLLEEKFFELLPNKNIEDIARSLNIPLSDILHHICANCGAKQAATEANYEFVCPSCDSRRTMSENKQYLNCEKCSKLMVKHDYSISFCPSCGGKAFKQTINISKILEIDTLLISSRHLYRAPYSLHEKSGLVSLPIDKKAVLTFDRATANPNTINTTLPFLERKANPEEAKHLLMQAFDFTIPKQEKEKTKEAAFDDFPATALPEKFFPPCIQKINTGLEDGKKRALFILINFLRSAGWSPEQIEQYITDWNKRNNPPLRENYIVGQLRYTKTKKPVLPPNCTNTAYYSSMGIKCPESICSRCTNPIAYAKQQARRQERIESASKKLPKTKEKPVSEKQIK